MNDKRIVYGARCMWWGSISEVGHAPTRSGHPLPCCPHCGGVLMEVDSIETWMQQAQEWEANGHPGYGAFLAWLRGKCYPNMDAAQNAFAEATT